MAMKDGSLILVKIGSVLVDALTSNTFQRTWDLLETTTKDSAGSKEYLVGEGDSEMSLEGKLDETDTNSAYALLAAGDVKSSVAFIHGGTTAGSKTISGNAVISNVSLNSPLNGIQTWSATLKVTGAITIGVV
jgi:predicted secreted protein